MSNLSTSYDQYTAPKIYSQLLGSDYNGDPTGDLNGVKINTLKPSSFGQASGLDQVSTANEASKNAAQSSTGGMANAGMQAMNAGGSAGQALTGAGIYGMMTNAAAGPYALAGGLALTAYENSQKADAMNEQARIQEEQQRKQSTQNAVNGLINVTRGLGV